MRLKELVGPSAPIVGDAEAAIAGLTADSREAGPGFLFAAVPGAKADGLDFVEAAVASGAVAVLAERPPARPLPAGVAFVQVENARRALAIAAARLYPRQPGTIVAVTGTAGKTSVGHFTQQIWTRLGRRAAYVGTLGLISPGETRYGNLTTPDPVALHRLVDRLAGEGITHLALEASSHGLHQHRLDGLRLAAGAFTNLGRDHLDYHPTMEDYLAAKLRLFDGLLPEGAAAIVSLGSGAEPGPGVEAVLAASRARKLRLLTTGVGDHAGSRAGADIRATVTMEDLRQVLRFDPPLGGRVEAALPLAGAFQADNALVAAALAIACGEEPGAVVDCLAHLKGVPGRLELVGRKNGAGVFVDYAHKPEALAEALRALRPFVRPGGRLVALFGCGGDRDPGKRPLMGEVAARHADLVIVTDDNPRSEDPAAIRAAILAAAPAATEIGDRGEAIRRAVAMLGEGDALLIAGKGHETGQTVGDRTLPFSDHEAARAALAGMAAHA